MHDVYLRVYSEPELQEPPFKSLKISTGVTIPQALDIAERMIYPFVPKDTYLAGGLVGVGIISAVEAEIVQKDSADETVLTHPLASRIEIVIRPGIVGGKL